MPTPLTFSEKKKDVDVPLFWGAANRKRGRGRGGEKKKNVAAPPPVSFFPPREERRRRLRGSSNVGHEEEGEACAASFFDF